MSDHAKCTAPPPDPGHPPVFRQAFLWRLGGTSHLETFHRVEDLLDEWVNEAGLFGSSEAPLILDETQAALVDLGHVIGDLDLAFQDAVVEDEQQAALARDLVRWCDRLRSVEREMREALST